MNEITTVCNTFVYKRFSLIEKFVKEMKAAEVLSGIVPGNVPEILLKGDNLCVMEFLEGTNGAEVADKDIITLNVAGILVSIYQKYSPLKRKMQGSWNNSLKKLKKDLNDISVYLPKKVYTTLTDKLSTIVEETAEYEKLTYVHRDLHLGNVVLSEKGCYLIDFEHAMEAPVELEFQNSIFWNDQMSLNVPLAINVLQSNGVPYNQKLEKLLYYYYVADQLVLAVKENDMEKRDMLLQLSTTSF